MTRSTSKCFIRKKENTHPLDLVVEEKPSTSEALLVDIMYAGPCLKDFC